MEPMWKYKNKMRWNMNRLEGVSPTPGLPVVKAFKDENKYTLDPL